MDQFGEDILAGLPPDFVLPALEDVLSEEALSPDIDVPFTYTAQIVIDRCAELANEAGGESTLSEHMLQAMSESTRSAAAVVAAEEALSNDELLDAFEFVLGRELVSVKAPVGQHPRLERVIIRSKRLAYRYHHAEASTLHLLWALLWERSSSACFALERQAASQSRKARFSPRSTRISESD